MLKKLILVLSAFLVFVSEVSGSDKTVILVTHESPPYSGNKLKNKGVIADIVAAAFNKEGYNVKITVVPWKRGFEGTKMGLYDGLFGCWYRKEREQWFIYSKPLIANEIIFLRKTKNNITFNGDYNSLKKYKIGYIRGYADPPGFELIKDSLQTEMVTDNIQNLEKLKRDRVDLIMIDRLLSRYLIKTKMNFFSSDFKEIDYILARDPNYLVFSKKSKNIQAKVKAFEKGLKYLKEEGIMDKIMKTHGL